MKDRCGFLFVHYKRHYCTELVSWEHAACPLSGIKKRPLVGGWLNISSIVISIGATASVRYREAVRSREGPLWEVPLYLIPMVCSWICPFLLPIIALVVLPNQKSWKMCNSCAWKGCCSSSHNAVQQNHSPYPWEEHLSTYFPNLERNIADVDRMTESFAYNYYDNIIMKISLRVPLLVLVYSPDQTDYYMVYYCNGWSRLPIKFQSSWPSSKAAQTVKCQQQYNAQW